MRSSLDKVAVIVVGLGKIGSMLLEQISTSRDALARRYGLELRLVAALDLCGACIRPTGLSDLEQQALVAARRSGHPLANLPGGLADVSAQALVEQVAEAGVRRAIVVDTTAADGNESALACALEQGFGVVMANKRPLAGPWSSAQLFFEHPLVRFEATVGAGLPVIHTLRYLVDAGDRVRTIQGALSGTLGYLCTCLEDGQSFSAAVAQARALEYTEPDPRDDLGGMDVARKALILARLAGWPLELSAFSVERLFPDELAGLELEEFMACLPVLDGPLAARLEGHRGVPRYLAEINPDGGSVALQQVRDGLAAHVRGPLNQISLITDRYANLPLSLVGPGAGVSVTAAAVLNDCLQVALTMI